MPKSVSALLSVLLFLLLSNCSSTKVNVFSHHSSASNPADMKTFGIARLSAEEPEVEREILRIVRKQLEDKGLKFVNNNPDFLVATHFYIGAFQKYVPPSTLTMRDLNPSPIDQVEETMTSRRSRPTARERQRDRVTKQGYTFQGYYDTKFYQNIQLYFVSIPSKDQVEIVWQGEIDSQNKKEDILSIAPKFLEELLNEFPQKTGKEESRKLKI